MKKWRSDVLNVQSSSYLFLKKKGWILVIFRKLLKRESRVIVAIEADNVEEANKTFEEWYNNDNNIESTSQLLAEREKDSEDWLISFPNWESLNRSNFDCADFIIEKPDDEPRYDLYFFIDGKRKYYCTGVTMRRVAQELSYYDETYKLTRAAIGKHIEDIECPTKNQIMAFEAVKRSEDK